MSDTTIRVMLVDDHTLFRKGLVELLDGRGGIQVVAATGSAADARALVSIHQPDVLIIDLNMGPDGGLALLRSLRAEGWKGPTVVLTVSDADDDLANAVRAGVRGYLLKDMEPDDVVDAIQRALKGETVVAPAMTLKLVSLLQAGPRDSAPVKLASQLTARELEILDHVVRGLSNKAIARELAISHDTVKLHVRHILSKLNLTSRVEAAVFAVEHGIAASRVRVE